MGNCQAIDAATLVVQNPSGKVDKYYWAVSASEIMKMNPGHYVALLLSTTLYPTSKTVQCPDNTATSTSTTTTVAVTTKNSDDNSVRITRIKLLKPTDTLVLGHVYRLITTQEVMKVLWAKKQARIKKDNQEPADKTYPDIKIIKRSQTENDYHHQVSSSSSRKERIKAKAKTITGSNSGSTSNATARSRTTWQPSLQSISETVS